MMLTPKGGANARLLLVEDRLARQLPAWHTWSSQARRHTRLLAPGVPGHCSLKRGKCALNQVCRVTRNASSSTE